MAKAETAADLVTRVLGGMAGLGTVALGADPATAVLVGAGVSTAARTAGEAVVGRIRATGQLCIERAAADVHAALAARLSEIDDEGERRRIAELAGTDPSGDEILFETWRELFSIHDGGVRPCLAALGAEYWVEHRPLDTFFRSASALLSGTTSEELPELRRILEAVATASSVGAGTATLMKLPTEGNWGSVSVLWRPDPCDEGDLNVESQTNDAFMATPVFERVAARLKAHGFAFDSAVGGYGGGADPARELRVADDQIHEVRALLKFTRVSPAAYDAAAVLELALDTECTRVRRAQHEDVHLAVLADDRLAERDLRVDHEVERRVVAVDVARDPVSIRMSHPIVDRSRCGGPALRNG